jgi:hypothetical protein
MNLIQNFVFMGNRNAKQTNRDHEETQKLATGKSHWKLEAGETKAKGGTSHPAEARSTAVLLSGSMKSKCTQERQKGRKFRIYYFTIPFSLQSLSVPLIGLTQLEISWELCAVGVRSPTIHIRVEERWEIGLTAESRTGTIIFSKIILEGCVWSSKFPMAICHSEVAACVLFPNSFLHDSTFNIQFLFVTSSHIIWW